MAQQTNSSTQIENLPRQAEELTPQQAEEAQGGIIGVLKQQQADSQSFSWGANAGDAVSLNFTNDPQVVAGRKG